MAKTGLDIVVGGHGFGVGSSREVAVNALKGAAVKAVIARSFAFIYARNQPNLGLLGIVLQDEAFYELAQQGAAIKIDLEASVVECGGKRFPFALSDMEKQLIAAGGITGAFKKFGKQIFDELCRLVGKAKRSGKERDLEDVASPLDY